jgi:hypothetical protein
MTMKVPPGSRPHSVTHTCPALASPSGASVAWTTLTFAAVLGIMSTSGPWIWLRSQRASHSARVSGRWMWFWTSFRVRGSGSRRFAKRVSLPVLRYRKGRGWTGASGAPPRSAEPAAPRRRGCAPGAWPLQISPRTVRMRWTSDITPAGDAARSSDLSRGMSTIDTASPGIYRSRKRAVADRTAHHEPHLLRPHHRVKDQGPAASGHRPAVSCRRLGGARRADQNTHRDDYPPLGRVVYGPDRAALAEVPDPRGCSVRYAPPPYVIAVPSERT